MTKIQEGMIQDQVDSVVAPLLGPLGGARFIINIQQATMADVGWHDAKTGIAIIVNFKADVVVGTSTQKIL